MMLSKFKLIGLVLVLTAAFGVGTTSVFGQGIPSLSINDVSQNEGNSGTTAFTFTVSLTVPAPPGGVIFDIATANGTAVAPGDYTAGSVTGLMIPTGNSSLTYTVQVNGDTTPRMLWLMIFSGF